MKDVRTQLSPAIQRQQGHRTQPIPDVDLIVYPADGNVRLLVSKDFAVVAFVTQHGHPGNRASASFRCSAQCTLCGREIAGIKLSERNNGAREGNANLLYV